MDLSSETFLFLDCQTTGLSPQRAELLEIGWSLSFAAQEVETRLIKPVASDIPTIIWKVTGLKPEEVAQGAEPEKVWTEILDQAERAGVKRAVIHYSQFEMPFLKALHEKVKGEKDLPWDVICTCRVAQRIHPGLPAKTIRALGGRFGFAVPEAHRSQGHVQATQKIWQSLISELRNQGVKTWESFQSWVATKPDKPAKKTKSHLTPRKTRLALPEGPGVYEFYAQDGRLLYVGKATSLRSRVNSYYTQRHTKRNRMNEMMTQASDIRITETATALEAALLENDKIKTLRPPYNTSLLGETQPLYLSFELNEIASNCSTSHPWGPFVETHAFDSLQRLTWIQREELEKVEMEWFKHTAEAIKTGVDKFLTDRGVAFDDLTPRRLYRLGKTLRDPAPEDEIEASIQRKLRRAVRHVHLARWRGLLANSRIWWKKPDDKWRFLEMRDGLIYATGDKSKVAAFKRPPISFRSSSMDRQTYDRIRILMTETLILAKKTDVCIQLSPSRSFSIVAGEIPEWLKPASEPESASPEDPK